MAVDGGVGTAAADGRVALGTKPSATRAVVLAVVSVAATKAPSPTCAAFSDDTSPCSFVRRPKRFSASPSAELAAAERVMGATDAVMFV